MKKNIENLQNQPEPVKQMIMWVGIFLIMSVIFFGWLTTFSWQLPETENTAAAGMKEELPGVWKSLEYQTDNLFKVLEKING